MKINIPEKYEEKLYLEANRITQYNKLNKDKLNMKIVCQNARKELINDYDDILSHYFSKGFRKLNGGFKCKIQWIIDVVDTLAKQNIYIILCNRSDYLDIQYPLIDELYQNKKINIKFTKPITNLYQEQKFKNFKFDYKNRFMNCLISPINFNYFDNNSLCVEIYSHDQLNSLCKFVCHQWGNGLEEYEKAIEYIEKKFNTYLDVIKCFNFNICFNDLY